MKIIFKSILVVIWLVVIFLFSNQNANTSTALTNSFIENIFWFTTNNTFFIIIRKLAHFMEYFILGILVYNLFYEFLSNKIILSCLLFCIICASLDELHQLFISGRSGRLFDVVIDSLGSSCSLFFIKIIKKYRKV